jgi:uncharacterized membrane protein
MIDTLGRLHPLIIHLPIGCLLLAALFQYLIVQKKRPLQDALRITLLVGMSSAFIACITGYLLSDEQAETKTMTNHMWLGIATFLCSAWAWYANQKSHAYAKWLIYGLVILVSITGHFGGSLTHGEDYLYPKQKVTEKKVIANINEAVVYEDLIAPILTEKCYQCHSSQRQKGKLKLDELSSMIKGGESGSAFVAKQAMQSLMVKRMLLPLQDEKHMPPKSKAQPNSKEIAIIQWWIDNGASPNIKTKDCQQDEKIKNILASWNQVKSKITALPEITAIPDDAAIKHLNSRGTSLQPLNKESKLYTINFIANDSITNEDIVALDKIKNHVYVLKLGNCKFNKKILENITSYNNLNALYLENTKLRNEDVKSIAKLENLQYLNVVNNKLSMSGIENLCQIKSLKNLYLFQNDVDEKTLNGIREKYKAININGESKLLNQAAE